MRTLCLSATLKRSVKEQVLFENALGWIARRKNLKILFRLVDGQKKVLFLIW